MKIVGLENRYQIQSHWVLTNKVMLSSMVHVFLLTCAYSNIPNADPTSLLYESFDKHQCVCDRSRK